jgi:hypothetical protein
MNSDHVNIIFIFILESQHLKAYTLTHSLAYYLQTHTHSLTRSHTHTHTLTPHHTLGHSDSGSDRAVTEQNNEWRSDTVTIIQRTMTNGVCDEKTFRQISRRLHIYPLYITLVRCPTVLTFSFIITHMYIDMN